MPRSSAACSCRRAWPASATPPGTCPAGSAGSCPTSTSRANSTSKPATRSPWQRSSPPPSHRRPGHNHWQLHRRDDCPSSSSRPTPRAAHPASPPGELAMTTSREEQPMTGNQASPAQAGLPAPQAATAHPHDPAGHHPIGRQPAELLLAAAAKKTARYAPLLLAGATAAVLTPPFPGGIKTATFYGPDTNSFNPDTIPAGQIRAVGSYQTMTTPPGGNPFVINHGMIYLGPLHGSVAPGHPSTCPQMAATRPAACGPAPRTRPAAL